MKMILILIEPLKIEDIMADSTILILGILVFALLIFFRATKGDWKRAHFKILRIIEMFFEK